MTTTIIALTLIVGVLTFAAGAFLASEIATRILRRREREISEERKKLNAAWSYLREVYGVKKPTSRR
jgi:cell division protein FtsL